jgi:exodeoxyribonuclease VII small subunit
MTKKKSEQFEEALKNLERIVEKLERGDLPLEEALAAFTEGVRLVQLCHKKLEDAENQVQLLLKNQQGEWCAVPFESSTANNSEG